MMTNSSNLFPHRSNRERMDELCCLFASGELSQQEMVEFSEHLEKCSECRAHTEEFQKLIVFDLSSAAALRMDSSVADTVEFSSEQELITKIRNRAASVLGRHESQTVATQAMIAPCVAPIWKRTASASTRFIPWLGWAAAVFLLMVPRTNSVEERRTPSAIVAVAPSGAPSSSDYANLEGELLALQSEKKDALKKLRDTDARARSSGAAVAQLIAQKGEEDARRAELAAEIDRLRADLGQRTAELEIARNRLNEEVGARQATQQQLADAGVRLEKQRSEVLRLQEMADSTPAKHPMSTVDLSPSEAKEILGARDLHIVDVYDVDNGGKSSKVYGRIYQVNRSLLIFYAFDLPGAQKNRKAVAFQAWGFRQPHSTKAESLGLFYVDNASLNRWALRVSDPRLISRIDTLFVTLEPLGGSSTPKGQKLLMASLAGPANHP